jgi:nicotinamidase-related amidase
MAMTVAPIIPARTALLLMDFQAPMLNGVPDAETLLARARAALAWARSEHVRVVYVRVAFAPEDFDAVPAQQRRSVDAERRPALLADPGTENSRHLPFEKSKDL